MSLIFQLEYTQPDYRPPFTSDQLVYEWREHAFERTATYEDNQRSWLRRMIDEGQYLPTG